MMKNQNFYVSKMVDKKIVVEKIPVVTEGCFFFFNAQHLYLQLETIERSYFDFICERMDYEHRISLNNAFRKKYISHYNKITSSKNAPIEAALHMVEKKLIDLKLVISVKGQRDMKYVNPKYVMKGTLNQRVKKLQELAEMANKNLIDISAIINSPVDNIQSEAL